MIRTHKPRGYQWSNSSVFQQTKEFRNINLEESTPLPARVLCPGSDEKRSTAERAAKRRRIEKLADNFLNGEPLYISAVRPCPEQLKQTVVTNQKSSSEPKFVLPDVGRSEVAADLWEDVQDDLEILKAAVASREPAVEDESEGNGTTEEQASASCGRSKRVRVLQLAAGPSEEALRIAAALRNRKARELQSNAQNNLRSGHDPESEQENHAPRDGEAYRTLLEHELPEQSSDWLSRRKSHAFCVDAVDAIDASLDELRLSRIETPSRQLGKLQQASKPYPRTHEISPRQDGICSANQDTPQGDGTIHETVTPAMMMITRDGEHCPSQRRRNTSSENSQNSRPIDITPNPLPDVSSSNAVSQSAPAWQTHSTVPLVTPVQVVPQDQTPGPHHYSLRVYAAKEPAQNGSTPFMFRRRGSGVDTGPSREGESGHPRRSTRLRSSKSATTGPEGDDLAPPTPAVVGMRRPMKFLSQPMSSPRKKPNRSSFGKPQSESARCTSEPPTIISPTQNNSSASVIAAAAEPSAENDQEAEAETQFWPGTQVLMHEAQRDFCRSPEKQAVVRETEHISSTLTPAPTAVREPLRTLSQEQQYPSTQALLGMFEGFSTVKKARSAYRESPAITPTVGAKAKLQSRSQDSPTTSSRGTLLLPPQKSNRHESGLRHSITSSDTPARSAPPTVSRNVDSSVQPPADLSSTELATPESMRPSRSSLHSHPRRSPDASTAMQLTSLPRQRCSSKLFEASATDDSLPTNPLVVRGGSAAAPASPDLTSAWDVSSFHAPLDVSSFQEAQREDLFSFQPAQRQSSMMSESQLNRTIDELDAEFLALDEMNDLMS